MKIKNAILVATERSGTNYFLDIYAKTIPESLAFREIFRSRGDSFVALRKLTGFDKEQLLSIVAEDPLKLWQNMEAEAAQRGRNIIAKIFYDHATDHPQLWRYLKDNNRVIHLIRRNPFDVLISRKVANQTGKWRQEMKDNTMPSPEPFELPRREVERYLSWHKEQVTATRAFFQGADYSEVFYEDISIHDRACADAVIRIVGITRPTNSIVSDLVKQKNYSNHEIVDNYEAIRDLDRAAY